MAFCGFLSLNKYWNFVPKVKYKFLSPVFGWRFCPKFWDKNGPSTLFGIKPCDS
jgi:hypothetical protein